MIVQKELSAVHLDSCGAGYNTDKASVCAQRVARWLGVNVCGFEEADVPQQTNGSDCGVFVIAVASAVCEQGCRPSVADDTCALRVFVECAVKGCGDSVKHLRQELAQQLASNN